MRKDGNALVHEINGLYGWINFFLVLLEPKSAIARFSAFAFLCSNEASKTMETNGGPTALKKSIKKDSDSQSSWTS